MLDEERIKDFGVDAAFWLPDHPESTQIGRLIVREGDVVEAVLLEVRDRTRWRPLFGPPKCLWGGNRGIRLCGCTFAGDDFSLMGQLDEKTLEKLGGVRAFHLRFKRVIFGVASGSVEDVLVEAGSLTSPLVGAWLHPAWKHEERVRAARGDKSGHPHHKLPDIPIGTFHGFEVLATTGLWFSRRSSPGFSETYEMTNRLRVVPAEAAPLDGVEAACNRLHELITLLSGTAVGLVEVGFKQKEPEEDWQEPQDPLRIVRGWSAYEQHPKDLSDGALLLALPRVLDQMQPVLKRWELMLHQQPEVVDRLMSATRSRYGWAEHQFFDLIAVFESLMKKLAGFGTQNPCKGPSNPSNTAVRKMNFQDLFETALQGAGDVGVQLAAPRSIAEFATALKDTRNELAHLGKKPASLVGSVHKFAALKHRLQLLLDFHVLTWIGIPADEVSEAMNSVRTQRGLNALSQAPWTGDDTSPKTFV